MTKYLTTAEAAEILKVTPRRVVRLAAQGRLRRSEKFGFVWAIHPKDVADYGKTSRRGGKPATRQAKEAKAKAKKIGEKFTQTNNQ